MFFTGLAMRRRWCTRAACLCFEPEPAAGDYDCELFGILLNIPLNYAFVYGKFGMPALGGAGCGVATAVVFWFNALVLWLYVAKRQYFREFKLMDKFSKPDGRAFKQIWKLGMPIGLSFFLEVSLFSCIVFLVARLGEDYVAAQQVVISLTGVIYMIPQSVGAARHGAGGLFARPRRICRARYVAGVSLVLGLVLAVLTALLLVLFRHPLAGMYTDDAGVLAIAATVLLFAAVFQLADATQCVASYALRGYKIHPRADADSCGGVLGLRPAAGLLARLWGAIWAFTAFGWRWCSRSRWRRCGWCGIWKSAAAQWLREKGCCDAA